MKAKHKLVRRRLSVLELAETLGNVSEACEQREISRTQYYDYKSEPMDWPTRFFLFGLVISRLNQRSNRWTERSI